MLFLENDASQSRNIEQRKHVKTNEHSITKAIRLPSSLPQAQRKQ